jgi:CPA2 family monovalent cation:H+ antiporter-2
MALTVVLGVAGVTTIVFQRLQQPVVLGYILAGLVIGPHVPIPVVADPEIVHTLSELGVMLLMFGLGLEFSFGKLFRAAPTAGLTGLLQCSVMGWLGYTAGSLLGWTSMESIYTGAIVAISSTTIIAKAFDEQGIRGPLRELVVAILIVEDLVAVLLIALLTSLSSGGGVSATELAFTAARLAGFLLALVIVGLLIVPRLMRAVVRIGRPETITVAAVGICFGVSLLAQELGYSVALGGFVAGVLVAESGKAAQTEPLVNPVRDIFAAVFFVAVGMLIDPAQIIEHWGAVLLLTILVVGGKLAAVSLGAFMTGCGTRTSIAAGMSLAQIGEFSFIIASLGATLNVVGPHIYPVAVAVSAITTLLTPALIKRSDRFASFVDRKLPRALQTFGALYGSWISRLRATRHDESRSRLNRFARVLLLDVAAIATTLIAVSLSFDGLISWLSTEVGIERSTGRILVVIAAGLVLLPFLVSVLRVTRRFAHVLGEIAVPRDDSSLDLGRQPRTVLEAAVRLVGVLIAGSALVAITQPFLPGYTAAIILAIALVILGFVFWRSAAGLQGHVRAAAQAVIEALAAQTSTATPAPDPLAKAREMFPGLGAPVRFELQPTSDAIGRSLADLELRAATGATVLAIVRDGHGSAVPDAHDPLRPGDVLAIAGTDDSIAAASELLSTRRRGS